MGEVVGRSPLELAIERGTAPGGDLVAALASLGDYAVTTTADARALAGAGAQLAPDLAARGTAGDGTSPSRLRALVGLFQATRSREAFDVLRVEGMPYLLAIFDARLPVADGAEAEELLFLLKVAAMYRVEAVVEAAAAAAGTPVMADRRLWRVVFETFDANHPYRLALLNRLREPLPPGLAGVAYLEFANNLAREGRVTDHPFRSAVGVERLRGFLTDPDPARAGLALAATAALPFIDAPDRDLLLSTAKEHPAFDVRIEAARVAGRFGDEAAVRFLVTASLDPRYSRRAVDSLTELGKGGVVPSEALEPGFRATAELARWLSHPMEFGRPPDEVALTDSRDLFWPPTNDHRRLHVVRYRYEPSEPGGRPEEGYGMVGSVTFALFGESTLDLPPEDVYGLHCCWELQLHHDPRAPVSRSAAAGRAVLRAANDVGRF
jgi:hypothetical protein